MKQKKRRIGKVLGITAVIVVLLAIAAFYWLNRMPSSELKTEEQILSLLERGNCAACHGQAEDRPFYATWPIVGKMVSADIEKGKRHFNLDPVVEALKSGQTVDEVSLSMLDYSIGNRVMAPAKFYILHWGGYTTDKERDAILDWIRNERNENYSTNLAHADFANEPIYPIMDSLPVDAQKVELGFLLYHDTRLSVDNSISCASCHEINAGGVDHKQYSEGVGGQFGGVNAPTVFNSVFNFVQFWDGRAADLAEQAAGPPLNPVEMANTDWTGVIAKLNKDNDLKKRFDALYSDGITGENITDAIAEYERTLITPNSKFDLYLKGDKMALASEEIAGYEAFKDFKCATCHTGINMGGQSYEYMGMAADYFADRHAKLAMGLTEEDYGRFKQTKNEADKHRFKVPGLRNVDVTAPYYHDGTRKTTKEAVRDMINYQVGVPFTEADVESIDLFLKTLTGQYNGQILRAKAPEADDKLSGAGGIRTILQN